MSGLAALFVFAALVFATGSASGHGATHEGAASPADGRFPGQPDFERIGDATVEFHPRIKSYTLREPGRPVLFFHADAKTEVAATGGHVALPTHEVPPRCASSGNRVVVVYTHRPGEATTTPTGTLRSLVARMNYKIRLESARSSGWKRVVEMVVDCEAGQVRVHNVQTPSNSFTDINSTVKGALGEPVGSAAVKYLVFDAQSASLYAGQGGGYFGSYQKSGSNANAYYTTTAVTYGPQYWASHVPVHEVLHTFGAAQRPSGGVPNPPYSTAGFHCTDGIDVLCYEDGSGAYTETRCPASQGYENPNDTPIDCGYDTYFDSQSEPGEWLDQYWNAGGAENPFLKQAPVQAGDSAGVFRPGDTNWFLTNSTSGSPPIDYNFFFGLNQDLPVAGDWDGDGRDSAGVFRTTNANWYLTNTSDTGAPVHYSFNFGLPGDRVIAGDWDGDGKDSVGVFRWSTGYWFLTNQTSGSPNFQYNFSWGTSGDLPVAGDWDGDGKDSIGVYRPSTGRWYLSNSLSSPPIDYSFGFGTSNDWPVAGDWNGDGKDTIGIYGLTTAAWYIVNSFAPGTTASYFGFGWANNDLPVAGDWNGL